MKKENSGLGFVPRAKLDDFVIQNICKKLESKYWREKIEEGLREKIAKQEPPLDDGAEEIECALKEIDHKIDALLDLAEDGKIPLEVRDRLNKRLAEKKRLQKELEKLQNKTTRLANGSTLVVSRGIGMERGTAPRLRFLCRPEIAIVDLVPSSADSSSGSVR